LSPLCAIRSICDGWKGAANLKVWIVETSGNRCDWAETDYQDDGSRIPERNMAVAFANATSGTCRSIMLVDLGKNSSGTDALEISSARSLSQRPEWFLPNS
jgi:hypothetical protein